MRALWNLSATNKNRTAIVKQSGESIKYEQLYEDVLNNSRRLKSSRKQVIMILAKNNYFSIVNYLACLQNNDAVMLINADTPQELLLDIIESYHPSWIIGDLCHIEYCKYEEGIYKRKFDLNDEIHPDLALLLSTSGSTGSVKFVRLSKNNMVSNAKAIVEYLRITNEDRGLVNLPMFYSYGLSIINSHLVAGATMLLTGESVISKKFWEFVKNEKATSFAGVPYTYQMLQRIGFNKMELPSLRYFTQAGGRLNEKLVKFFGEYAEKHNKEFYVMYGQTEASPRISYVPPTKLLEKATSIGVAIPGGYLDLDSRTNELIFRGPNVMMGYATCISDLALGDTLYGILRTGDLAAVDADGFYYIKGRMKRFIKLFGLRLNLDDIEKRVESILNTNVVCVGTDDKMVVMIENEEKREQVQNMIEHFYKLHRSAFCIKVIETIPRLSNGKVNYEAVKDMMK